MPEIADDELLIEDISPEMLRQLEARATAHGRTVEEEVLVFLEIALQSAASEPP